MAKLKREVHALYIKTDLLATGRYYLIGKRIENLSVSMNGSFEQGKDITGQTYVTDSGYKPNISVSPYYADKSDGYYDYLLDLAMNRRSGDDAKVKILEVILDPDHEVLQPYDAWECDAVVEIVSYGGDTNGFQIAFNIWEDGNRKAGEVSFENGAGNPTFEANT